MLPLQLSHGRIHIHSSQPLLLMVLLVMGVAGSGKTTVAKLLADRLDWLFLEADDFHSPGNKQKMHAGIPLTDADRIPWLESIHQELLRQHKQGKNLVLACSALKEKYRRLLAADLPLKVIYLKGSFELIRARLHARHGHFAGEAILADQFANLEEPDAVTVSVEAPPEQIVNEIIAALGLRSSASDASPNAAPN
jgi:gluconokinase